MSLTTQTVQLLAVIGAGAGVVGVLLALLAHLRFRRLRRDYSVLQSGDDRESFVSAAARQVEIVARLRAELAAAERRIADLRLDVSEALRHVAVVRYDAFRDMGGRLSFSAALLDDAGDGLVLSAIHGRTETRTYSKGVKGGASDQPLSPEERQAIGFAMRSDTAPASVAVAGHEPTVSTVAAGSDAGPRGASRGMPGARVTASEHEI